MRVSDQVLRSGGAVIAGEHALALRLQREQQAMRRRELERRRRRARIRRNRMVALCGLAVLAAVGWLASAASTGATGRRGARGLQVQTNLRHVVVPGRLTPLSWPKTGQAAVALMGAGLVAASPTQRSVPIASLTKMMTAYLVLRDHPLDATSAGPSLVMTAADVASYVHASQTDESNAPVALGESLSERQLLEALLLPSADNIADTLAIWDAGSIAAFVQKMNAAAASLGLSHTHYADASGVNPGSRSTASEQALLAARLMASAAVRSIVRLPSVAFPIAGHIWAVNPALGHDGIVGVKSGYTSHALGCLAVAAWRDVGAHSALVVSVSLGQPDGLTGAARNDETLLDQTSKQLVSFRPLRPNGPVASLSTAGGPFQPLVLSQGAPSFVVWPGLRIKEHVSSTLGRDGAARSELVFSTPTGTLGSARLVIGSPVLAQPSGVSSS